MMMSNSNFQAATIWLMMLLTTSFLPNEYNWMVHGFSSSNFYNKVVESSSSSSSSFTRSRSKTSLFSSNSNNNNNLSDSQSKGKLLVLGGTGFLGQTICKRATLEGYAVTSISRRGKPSPTEASEATLGSYFRKVDYRQGDARQFDTIANILKEGGYVGVIHCIGLLFDDDSGLGTYNRFVSGSGSIPDGSSSYDDITRLTAFNAIDATLAYVKESKEGGRLDSSNFPFVFSSAAEAGWPDVSGGQQIEKFLAPDWLKRYLKAKREVEAKLNEASPPLRPVIVRPSLIYSLDRPASYVPVGAFFVGNRIGLPFVDRPVTVQSLANAMVRSISRTSVRGVQRYKEIDALNQ
ncbi:unnamed protein product [Cylindrotheca closterium]|uniref:NAD-dependent epimerase/dehydratase domain-containing protein n=1 Tax=Cylindrotheca closterium TaxID=2856 RepID=A0AAD2GC96_9STRA|nr:unnamed protein product [Cylindrotheca closterium]